MTTLNEIVDVIARHLPPSADRIRLRPLDQTARAWADALSVRHFVVRVEAGECDAALACDLAPILGMRLRPGGRAIFLLSGESRPLDALAAILQSAGFTRLLIEPVLDGAYILARGEPISDAMERDAELAASNVDLIAIAPGEPLPRYLFLLVHQEPPSRGWDQPDIALIAWDAVTLRERSSGRTVLLAFSSLVKAVAFMKPVALMGAMSNVNKMPRYRGETVAMWKTPVLLNPAFEVLRTDGRYDFDAPPLRVDPSLEDKVRE